MTEEATPKPIIILRNTNENANGITESTKPKKQVTFKRIVEHFTYTENWKMEMHQSFLVPDKSLQLGGAEKPKGFKSSFSIH